MYALSEMRKLLLRIANLFSASRRYRPGAKRSTAELFSSIRYDQTFENVAVVEITEYAESLGIAFDGRSSKELLVRKKC